MRDRINYKLLEGLEKSQEVDRKTWWLQPITLAPFGAAIVLIGVGLIARSAAKRKTLAEEDAKHP